MKTATQLNSIIIVGPVRMSYAHVFEPRHNDLSEKDEYSCVCLIPKEANAFCADPKGEIKKIADMVKAVAAEAGLKGEWRNPFKDGDKETNANGEPRHPGYWFISAKTGADYAPMVIDHRRVPIGKDSGYQSGDWAKVKIKVAAYDAKVNKGVTAYLQAVQWLHKDEPFGGNALDGFGEEAALGASSAPAGADDDFDPFAD